MLDAILFQFIKCHKAYNDINLTFICTNQFHERKLLKVFFIMPPDTNNMRFPKEKSRYYTQIKVIQYDELIKRIIL